jgi:hypothetical protein
MEIFDLFQFVAAAPSIVTAAGYIYCLYNEAYPYLLKIGFTQDSLEIRSGDIYHGDTGVPMKFTIITWAYVNDCKAAEKLLHLLFGDDRVNPRREFFGELTPLSQLFDIDKTIERIKKTEEMHIKVKTIFEFARACSGMSGLDTKKPPQSEVESLILDNEKGVCRKCKQKCGKTETICYKSMGCRSSERNVCECGRDAGRYKKCRPCHAQLQSVQNQA